MKNIVTQDLIMSLTTLTGFGMAPTEAEPSIAINNHIWTCSDHYRHKANPGPLSNFIIPAILFGFHFWF